MPLIENLATLLTEATATCGEHVPPVTATGGPVVLRLRGSEVAMSENLLVRLQPGLQAVEPVGAADVQDIRVVLDPGLTQRLDRALGGLAPTGRAGEPHLVWDGVHLVRKQAGAGPARQAGYLLWDQMYPQTNSIVLSGSGTAAVTVLLRLVRGVATRVLLAAGWIPLHAASVMTPVGAVCLLGGRGSGKTTALLHLLTGVAGPVALVANSLVFLSPAGAAEVRALPTAIGLRAPTIALFPALRSLIGETGVLADEGSRTYLPASAIAAAFGAAQSAGGSVRVFVDVAFRNAGRSAWQTSDIQRATAALIAAYLSDGLLDDPHEHARLAADHARGHHLRLRQCAESVAAARYEAAPDTATVLGCGVVDLVAQAAR